MSDFGVVPDGWKQVKISDIADIDPESLKQATDPSYQFRYIDIASVSTGKIAIPSERISFADAPSRARKKIQHNDVLMATVRPNLQAFAHYSGTRKDIVCSTGFAVIRSRKNSDSRFIFNAILSDNITKQIENEIAGSNYPAIRGSDVKQLTLPLPPLPEQKKIAEILTSVDAVIEKTEAQISKLRDLKKAMMTELLTKGIGHTEFKDSLVGRIPAAWKVFNAGDFLQQRKEKGEGELPLYSVLLEGGMVPRSSVERRVKSELDAGDNLTVRKGDLAYNMMRMWQGASGIGPVDCLVSPAYVVAAPDLNLVTSAYLGFLMKSSKGIRLLHRYSYGLTGDRLRLYFDSLEKIKFALPPVAEQGKIANVLFSIDERLKTKKQKLTQTKTLKKALMHDLLTGKKRVTVGSD